MNIPSDIKIDLPVQPLTKNQELYQELSIVYTAIRTLQLELTQAKARITELENP